MGLKLIVMQSLRTMTRKYEYTHTADIIILKYHKRLSNLCNNLDIFFSVPNPCTHYPELITDTLLLLDEKSDFLVISTKYRVIKKYTGD